MHNIEEQTWIGLQKMDHNDFFWIWQQELSNKAETDTSIKQKKVLWFMRIKIL